MKTKSPELNSDGTVSSKEDDERLWEQLECHEEEQKTDKPFWNANWTFERNDDKMENEKNNTGEETGK